MDVLIFTVWNLTYVLPHEWVCTSLLAFVFFQNSACDFNNRFMYFRQRTIVLPEEHECTALKT